MTPASAAAERPEAPLFSDGLGERIVAVDAATGDLLQILRVRPQLLAVPSFEFALRERAARLANFRHVITRASAASIAIHPAWRSCRITSKGSACRTCFASRKSAGCISI